MHRNWARWTSDPTWPLEALKGDFGGRTGEDGWSTGGRMVLWRAQKGGGRVVDGLTSWDR